MNIFIIHFGALHHTHHVMCLESFIFKTCFASKFCAQILCSDSVLRFCAQILCSNFVLSFVLRFCAQILCSNSVLRLQHSWVFSYIQNQLTPQIKTLKLGAHLLIYKTNRYRNLLYIA